MNLAQLNFSGSLFLSFPEIIETTNYEGCLDFFFFDVQLDPKEVCKVLLFSLPGFRLGGEQGS